MILSILASAEKRIEIILGENYVNPNLLNSTLTTTKNEVLKDPRVKYFPSNHYLTMSENWARSVQLSTGLYVAFVGADDGVVSDNLIRLITFLERCDNDLILTSYTTFGYAMPGQRSFVHFQERANGNSVFKIVFHPIINALFLETRELMMPVIFNKSVARRSSLVEAISNISAIPGIAPDNYLTHFMMHQQKKGVYLNLPVFISGSSEYSNGLSQAMNPTNPIFQQYSDDHQERRGILTMEYTLACLSSGMLEDYLTANNRTYILDNYLWRRCAKTWIQFSCFDRKHHKTRFFSHTLPMRRKIIRVVVRIIKKLWSIQHFGFTNHFKGTTILLPEDSTVLDIQEIIKPT